MSEKGQPKTAFVFAGGSLGAIQVGMLHPLASHGIVADMACGSSVGAINAAYYAGNPTIEGIRKLEAIWRGLRRQDVFPISLGALFGFIRRRDFLITSGGLKELIETHLPYRNLEDARIPVFIAATDIISAETVVLSKGSACDAILASTAIPAAFAPVQIQHLFLADGAISSNTPARVAVANGAERLIILPTGYACARQTPPVGAVANALHALTLLIARQLITELEHLEERIEYYVLPPLCPLECSPYDFTRTGELIARAIASTDEWIDGGGLMLPRTHAQLGLHKHKQKQ
jgi:NTE family protein